LHQDIGDSGAVSIPSVTVFCHRILRNMGG
jgi:hypothetical protein